LSLLDEMKFVHQTYPDIPLETVIRMGTQSGALALGVADRFGTLEPGKIAKFGFW
jgi:predicted amidohydrolase YtcJ